MMAGRLPGKSILRHCSPVETSDLENMAAPGVGSADGLTLANVSRDFTEWRRGRPAYAVWALDLAGPVLNERSARCRAHLADCLLPDYGRAPHLTVHLCGFPAPRAELADDYAADVFAAQVASLAGIRWVPFAIDIGRPDSFTSAAYFSVHDPARGIEKLRLALAGERPPDDVPYLPHVSFGLYRVAVPLATVLARLATVATGQPWRFEVGKLALMSYQAAVIGGPLSTLAEFDLVAGRLHVRDAPRLAELFGEAWSAPGFSGK